MSPRFERKEEERKLARDKAQELFSQLDRDKNGFVDRAEFALLTKMMMRKYPQIQLLDSRGAVKPFDLEEDFKLMDRGATGEAPFEDFNVWWRGRTGDDDADIPVLPESMVNKINEIGALLPAQSGDSVSMGARSGAALWNFLRPRLGLRWGSVASPLCTTAHPRYTRFTKICSTSISEVPMRPNPRLLVKMESRWGNIRELYSTSSSSSRFLEKQLPPGVRHPDSTFSAYWDVGQIFALLYVSALVPFRVSMGITICHTSFAFWVDAFVDVYFIADLVLAFRTGMLTQGVQEGPPGPLALVVPQHA